MLQTQSTEGTIFSNIGNAFQLTARPRSHQERKGGCYIGKRSHAFTFNILSVPSPVQAQDLPDFPSASEAGYKASPSLAGDLHSLEVIFLLVHLHSLYVEVVPPSLH